MSSNVFSVYVPLSTVNIHQNQDLAEQICFQSNTHEEVSYSSVVINIFSSLPSSAIKLLSLHKYHFPQSRQFPLTSFKTKPGHEIS